MYSLADKLELRVELRRHHSESVPTIHVVIAYQFFRAVDALADFPTRVPAVHIVDEHLKMLYRLCCKREFQPSVNRVSELPYLGFRLIGFERDGVLEIPAVLHLESLRAFERVPFALIDAVRADGYLYMLRKRVMERQVVVALYYPVSVTVVVNRNIEYFYVLVVVYYHALYVQSYFTRISPYSRYLF